jgi:hypothetical protein
LRNLVLDRLDPSHALNAIRSPRPPQKLGNQHCTPQKPGQSQNAIPIGGLECKFRSPLPDLQSFCVVQHLKADCKSTETQEQRRKQQTNQRRHGGISRRNQGHRFSNTRIGFMCHMPGRELPI